MTVLSQIRGAASRDNGIEWIARGMRLSLLGPHMHWMGGGNRNGAEQGCLNEGQPVEEGFDGNCRDPASPARACLVATST